MFVYAVLNNYQMGSQAHNCLSMSIKSQVRLDKNHTLVCWELADRSERQLLVIAMGNREYRVKDMTKPFVELYQELKATGWYNN